ncbi:MAG TPA: hypothetical protein VNV82_25510 [Bryobacteraceae bacterium]|nr:hypothetical protein [Bryobacteraceae bacterium]
MTARIAAASAAFLLVLCAQDAPRSKATDYPARIALTEMEIGAEYLVHSIPSEKGDYFAKEYLVVEVAIFPTTKSGLKISSGRFTLRINKKSTLSAQSAGMVAAALKYADWEQRPQMTATAGPLIYGAPQGGRFPGDPTTPRPLPNPVPSQTGSGNVDKQSDLPIDEAISRAALPEGVITEHVKGCLFFRFEGKLKSIKSLDLIYETGPNSSPATIPLL